VATSPFGPRSIAPRDNGTDRMYCPLATPTQVPWEEMRKTAKHVIWNGLLPGAQVRGLVPPEYEASADGLCLANSGILADLFESFTEQIRHFTVI
jgi:hypothetical protein